MVLLIWENCFRLLFWHALVSCCFSVGDACSQASAVMMDGCIFFVGLYVVVKSCRSSFI